MSRAAVLWSLFALQAICCAYFLMDIAWDLLWPISINRFAESDVLEALVTIALFFGLAFTGNELRQILTRQDQLEDQIKVAILAIKGFSISEMADLRETKQGTIKAQCASVYKKAGVSGRLQLLSIFLDDLMADSVITAIPQGTA